MRYLVEFSSRPEAVIGIIPSVLSSWFGGPIVPYRDVNFLDPRFNRSGKIEPKAVQCGIFGRFSNFDNCRPEVAGDVISGAALDNGFVVFNVRHQFQDTFVS